MSDDMTMPELIAMLEESGDHDQAAIDQLKTHVAEAIAATEAVLAYLENAS